MRSHRWTSYQAVKAGGRSFACTLLIATGLPHLLTGHSTMDNACRRNRLQVASEAAQFLILKPEESIDAFWITDEAKGLPTCPNGGSYSIVGTDPMELYAECSFDHEAENRRLHWRILWEEWIRKGIVVAFFLIGGGYFVRRIFKIIAA